MCRLPGVYLFRFFAGFGLVANGVYIGTGWLLADGADPSVMTENGSPVWVLVLFGLLAAPFGLFLWHRQGSHFGLGEANGKVSKWATVISAALFLALVGFELIRNRRYAVQPPASGEAKFTSLFDIPHASLTLTTRSGKFARENC